MKNNCPNKGLLRSLYVLIICAMVSSCGYHLGSIMHPQVKTIAIATVKNDTIEPEVSAWLRQSLAEQFEFDGSLKVKELSEADCILYARVYDVETTSTSTSSFDGNQTFSTAEFGVAVKVEYTVIIPGRSKPLVELREVEGEAKYQVLADNNIARRRGVQQACREVARQAVIYVVEAW
ncbi:MAG TPA: LPS assembly lipoprotein LptE [Victivallales bacterium]|nr:LPS assembly lipoprotein LptE [Victivallales bacterium]